MYSTVYEIFTDTHGASRQHVIQWNKPKNDCESESIKQKHFQPELQYFKRTINQYLDHHTAKSKQPNFTQCTSEQAQKHLKNFAWLLVKPFAFLKAKWKCNKHYSQDATTSFKIHFFKNTDLKRKDGSQQYCFSIITITIMITIIILSQQPLGMEFSCQ